MSARPSDAYEAFVAGKSQLGGEHGFDPGELPTFLFDFQRALVEWALKKGRAAIFADTGLGKTAMQLVWADRVASHANGRVLILTPIAVGQQTVAEGARFGIECARSRDGQPAGRITVANYELLHRFSPVDFVGVVADESSIIKHATGATQKAVTRFMSKLPLRLLCTATPSPNDYIELGTSSEALGGIGYTDMLSRFFKQDDRKPSRIEDVKQARLARNGMNNTYGKLAFRVAQQIGQWRMKGHAVTPFWRWVASWARACRKPSDLGFDDARFMLPPLTERDHVIKPPRPRDGMLFEVPAFGLGEEREERRRTLHDRCERAAELVCAHSDHAIVWCHLNVEGDLLERLIPGAVQVAGKDSDEAKEEKLVAFGRGQTRVLVTKPKIGGWGLNWAHCAHVVTFATHSWEQHYQTVRRCWRFGQTRPVTVDVIYTEGETRVRANMARKAHAAEEMFAQLIAQMNDASRVARQRGTGADLEVPPWCAS